MPLSYIFNSTVSQNLIPSQWKLANVTALFKKGDPNSCKNYRPISLTCVASRICESIIADKIKEHIADKICSVQHGFTAKKSTVTQLFETYENWVDLIDNCQCIDVVFIDFAKAFDSVSHKKLISKLSEYGIRGNLLNWIEQFLKDRKQQVVVDGECSNVGDVISGVPQGSVLGPLLFLIYINDLYPNLKELCDISLFADDCKLFINYNSKNQVARSLLLQKALDKLALWANISQLSIQPDKCAVLHICYKNVKHQYSLNGQAIPPTESFKDLGVHMTPDLKFNSHILKIVQSASRTANLILRTFKTKKPAFMVKNVQYFC